MIWLLNKSLSTLPTFNGQPPIKIANLGLLGATFMIGVSQEIVGPWPSLGVSIFKLGVRGRSIHAISV